MAEVVKGPVVSESVLKKQKRNEEWAVAKKQEAEALKKKNAAKRKLIFNRAKQYSQEYEAQELIQLKREARLKGGFYVNHEAKMLFIIMIRGLQGALSKINGQNKERIEENRRIVKNDHYGRRDYILRP